jgi:glycosyltransferase involved in cell wall biosynthesis
MTVAKSLGFLRGQIGFMKERGVEVSAIASPDDGLEAFGRLEGIRTYAVEMPRRITPVRDVVALVRLWRRLRRLRPDIVHAHTPKGGLLGTVAAALARVRVRIYHIHGLPLLTAKGYRKSLLRWRDEAVREGLCPAVKIRVLRSGSINGVDSRGYFNPGRFGETDRLEVRRRFGIDPGAPVVGFVGRVVRDKGVRELVKAWKMVRSAIPNARLLVIGEFEEQDSPGRDTIEAMESDRSLCLAGKVTSGMAPFYAAMDLLALPTYREGFPVTAMEAASMGLPVVATRVPGCVDAVEDGVTGTLVPVRDAEALAGALERYLLDEELRREHGAAGRARMTRDFGQAEMWNEVHAQYERLLQRSDSGGTTVCE